MGPLRYFIIIHIIKPQSILSILCLSGCRAVSAAPMVSCSRTSRLNLTYKTSCAINNVTVYSALMDMCSKTRIYVYYVCVPPPPVPGLRGIQRQELRLIKRMR